MENKLLIADDNESWLVVVKDLVVSELNYPEDKIIIAHDGREAREIIMAKKCSKVLSDNKMPYFSGLELLAEVRACPDEEIANMPFAILSSFIDCEEVIKVFKATACIDKNMPIKIIIEALAAHLSDNK